MTLWILSCKMTETSDILYAFYAKDQDDAQRQASKIVKEQGYEGRESKAPCFCFLLSGIMPDSELSCLVFPPFGLSEMYWPQGPYPHIHILPRSIPPRPLSLQDGNGSWYPNQDRHKAPASIPSLPLSLQDEGDSITLFGRQKSFGTGGLVPVLVAPRFVEIVFGQGSHFQLQKSTRSNEML